MRELIEMVSEPKQSIWNKLGFSEPPRPSKFFHGTSSIHLPTIRISGLSVAAKSNYPPEFYEDNGPSVYLGSKFTDAASYAKVACYHQRESVGSNNPIVLVIQIPHDVEVLNDENEFGSFIIKQDIIPAWINGYIRVGKTGKRLGNLQPLAS